MTGRGLAKQGISSAFRVLRSLAKPRLKNPNVGATCYSLRWVGVILTLLCLLYPLTDVPEKRPFEKQKGKITTTLHG